MKKNTVKLLCFLLIFILILGLFELLSMWDKTEGYVALFEEASSTRLGSDEIEPIIDMVRGEDSSHILVLGDSVANQLLFYLGGRNDEYLVAATNQAITMAGQYVLLNEYLCHHDATDVYLVFVPETLHYSVRGKLTYPYVAMSFIGNGYGEYFDETIMNPMEDMYGKLFLKQSVIRFINSSCVNRKLYYSYLDSHIDTDEDGVPLFMYEEPYNEDDGVSDISENYLRKMKELCDSQGVSLHLASGPIKDIELRRNRIDAIEKSFHETGLDELFPSYFEGFVYYPESMFKDELHFIDEFAEGEPRDEIVSSMLDANSELEGLREVLTYK